MRKHAVILDRPTKNVSYSDMVRKVKKMVHGNNLTSEITTRRAKSGNIILETASKEQADSLAGILKEGFGDTTNIRRPSPTVSVFLMGIEDSVQETEFKEDLEVFGGELKDIRKVVINKSRNGVRTAVIHAPLRAGRRLIELKRIKIGWGMCRIKEFDTRDMACNKCRVKGHSAKNCSGPERRKCFRCKEARHLIAHCTQIGKPMPTGVTHEEIASESSQ